MLGLVVDALCRHVLTCDAFMVNSTLSALAKLKGASGGLGKTPQAEKKETPQERLKRIMSKQLNKQSMSLLLLFFILICVSDPGKS